MKYIEKGFLQQWKYYLNWIHYKIALKKKVEKLQKESKKLGKDLLTYDNLIKLNNNEINKRIKLFSLESVDKKDTKNIYLIGKTLKYTGLQKLYYKLFKFDGWILSGNKTNNFKFIKVKNIKSLYNAKNKELYNIHEKVGYYKNKPLFITKYPHAITLDIKDNGELCYDVEAYYNYVNYATKQNLLNIGKTSSLGEMIKNNKIIILIIVVIIIILVTPEGKQLVNDILGTHLTP